MKRIYKKDDLIDDIDIGDVLEITDDIFVKITKLTRDVSESLGGTTQNKKEFDAVVIDLNGK